MGDRVRKPIGRYRVTVQRHAKDARLMPPAVYRARGGDEREALHVLRGLLYRIERTKWTVLDCEWEGFDGFRSLRG
jgi:hypothetical protein